jgi:hypothetical protein
MGCKGICIRYKADRPKSGLRYIPGQKLCQICAIFINWQEGLLCPCCRSRLRGSPRKSKNKLTNLRAKKEGVQVMTIIIINLYQIFK